MTTLTMPLIDLAAITVLALGIYFPRHRRADLVVAFFGVNVGVLGVTTMLASADIGAGLGLGLFGVLSIIRLRSSEISQREVAYYFAALAIGLVAGMSATPSAVAIGIIVAIIAVLAVVDSQALFGQYRTQEILLDRAIADDAELRAAVTDITGGDVHSVTTLRYDSVNDTTLVTARYRTTNPTPAYAHAN